MERVKEQAKKFLVSILVFGLLVSIVQPVSVYAYKRANVTQTQGSELSDALSYEWNAVIEDKKLTVSILDADAGIAELTNSKYVAKLYVAEDGALQLKAGSNFSGTNAMCHIICLLMKMASIRYLFMSMQFQAPESPHSFSI